jgi:predicted small secreted protein
MADVNVKKKTFRLLALLSVIFALQGCATVQGIGEDIQSLGRAMKKAVSG